MDVATQPNGCLERLIARSRTSRTRDHPHTHDPSSRRALPFTQGRRSARGTSTCVLDALVAG